MNHVGFTGTQHGMTSAQRETVARLLCSLHAPDAWFHHGNCVGADEQASSIAGYAGYCIHLHPPTNDEKRAFTPHDAADPPLPYLTRNRRIVDATAALVAAPLTDEEQPRSGTWYTIRYARTLRRPVYIVHPGGHITEENTR